MLNLLTSVFMNMAKTNGSLGYQYFLLNVCYLFELSTTLMTKSNLFYLHAFNFTLVTARFVQKLQTLYMHLCSLLTYHCCVFTAFKADFERSRGINCILYEFDILHQSGSCSQTIIPGSIIKICSYKQK